MERAPLACAAALVTSCSPSSVFHEPFYQLRPASHWIERLGQSHIPNEIFGQSDPRKPAEALRKIGPAAVPVCIRLLKDDRWFVRAGAITALGLYGPESRAAIPALVEATQDENGQVRDGAAEALWHAGSESEAAIPLLAAALQHPDPVMRISVAYALVRLQPGDAMAFSALLEGLRYGDSTFGASERSGAGSVDGQSGSAPGSAARRALSTRAPEVRRAAANALWKLGAGAAPATPALIDALRNREYPETQVIAAYTLARIGPTAKPAVPVLLDILREGTRSYKEVDHSKPSDRLISAAGDALGSIRLDETALPTLLALLTHPGADLDARWNQFAGVHGVPEERLKDPVTGVAQAAASALRGVGPAGVPSLVALLKGPDPTLAKRATWALGRMGPDASAAVPHLIAALRHEKSYVRRGAMVALGMIGANARDAVPALVGVLQHGEVAERRDAIMTLRAIGPDARGAVPALRALLENESPQTREVAAFALETIAPGTASGEGRVASDE